MTIMKYEHHLDQHLWNSQYLPAFNKAVNNKRDSISSDGDKAGVGEPPDVIIIILDGC